MKTSRFIGAALLLAATATAASDERSRLATLIKDRPEAALLEKRCIRADCAGLVAVGFSSATTVLTRPDFLSAAQAEFVRAFPELVAGGVTVTTTAPGEYHYINEEHHRTDVVELYRQSTDVGTFDIVLLASGRRFFGSYDAIIHIRLLDAATAGTAYTAQIHAYPRSFATRFLARRFGTIERYFAQSSTDIAWLAGQIIAGLSQPVVAESAPVPLRLPCAAE